MIAFVAALALSGNCIGALCNGDALRPFFAKLPHTASRPIHILQIGDSHTAGDTITGAWRDILQQKYGSAGRGVLPPGRPFDGYITHGISVTMSPGWAIASDFGSTWSQPSVPLGLSAFTLTSTSDGASMALVTEPAEAFDRFTICAIVRPGAGSLALRAGETSTTFNLSSATERPECRTMHLPRPANRADLTVSGGPATLTSWATFRDTGGIALSNLGVVGSQLLHWARTDDTVIAEEIGNYRPDLIVLAFGTNEGFSPRYNAFEYEVTLRTQIGRIRRLAGNVPILLLGAPDALSRR
ncbi:MAG TPA: SGNH/GDSL hydrolase family protein, partial [Sphingomonas sp.]|nr:SGNH/GDSL hydrolase family protein [Sphingomonas sp.]